MGNKLIRIGTGVLICMALTVPGVAGRATTDRIEDFGSVLAVRFEEDFPIASLMRADCSWAQRTVNPNGSAVEKMKCTLSDEPVMIPAFQGVAPEAAFVLDLGPCFWMSDYVAGTAEEIEYAISVHLVVTPSGNVSATSFYPAEPLACEE